MQGNTVNKNTAFHNIAESIRRLLHLASARKLLLESVNINSRSCNRIEYAAADSSGFESGRISPYYVSRCARGRGPTPDMPQLEPLLNQLHSDLALRRLLLDAGYDNHGNHLRLRKERNILSYIPPHLGHPTAMPASSELRRLMQRHFATDVSRQRIHFGQHWQVETVSSMIKRNIDHAVTTHRIEKCSCSPSPLT